MVTCQGLILATAMAAISAGTIILFDLIRQNYFLSSQISQNQKRVLKSCLSSGSKKMEEKQRKKKKRVQFADDVKDSLMSNIGGIKKKNNGENEGLKKMPDNRVALYSGVLKNRLQRKEYSF